MKAAWNKGLTKDTDPRVMSYSNTMVKNKKSGGYRRNGGRGLRGYYKGIWCDSSWELAYVVYCLEHDIPIERNHDRFEYFYERKRIYIPDFKVEHQLIEIKGFVYDKKLQEEKNKSTNKPLIVIGKKDIQKYLDYVISKYGKNFITLYENKIDNKIKCDRESYKEALLDYFNIRNMKVVDVSKLVKLSEQHLRRLLKEFEITPNYRLKPTRIKGSISENKKIVMLTLTNNIVRKFESSYKAAKFIGKTRQHIIDCCKGKRKTAYGYKWKYD